MLDDTGTFLDRYVTKKCLTSSQSGCGADDGAVNGAGAAANDGEWATYELSHSLTGGGLQDIDRSTDMELGFFLTLRIGKGAQGNTQFPGFRDYRIITIVGF